MWSCRSLVADRAIAADIGSGDTRPANGGINGTVPPVTSRNVSRQETQRAN